MTGGTLGLGGTYSDFGAVQTDNATSLELNANTSITRSTPLEIGGLGFERTLALTLGSATTDLTIHSSLTVDELGFAAHHKCCRFDPDISPPAHSRSPSLPQLEQSLFPREVPIGSSGILGCERNNTKIE